ncbi:MAG: hypothetical protein KatS3mg060_1156 [Dehalococcoidia bacterium]|nr:MAG: hypothetical protein KatS3mg060_1156 [Dehalococcoidia bacterium]
MIPWAEYTHPEARVQDTETRVFVGGPLDAVGDNAVALGLATVTTAVATLETPFGQIRSGDSWVDSPLSVYLTGGAAFLSRGAVLIGDDDDEASWFTYERTVALGGGVTRLDFVRRIAGTSSNYGIGTRVRQWCEITSRVTRVRFSGEVAGNEATWQVALEGVNWNSQLIVQDASILIQQRQWDDITGAWTSWRDRFLGYLDQPEPMLDSRGVVTWRVTARGRNKYLRLTHRPARLFGLATVAGQRTASSTLSDPGVVPEEGGYRAGDLGPMRTADDNLGTLWVSAGSPVRNELNARGVSPNRAKRWIDYGIRIQQVYCSAPEGGRWSRQQQTWIEICNTRHPEDSEQPNGEPNERDTLEYLNNIVLENSRGQRVYLGRRNGYPIDATFIKQMNSVIVCYDADVFRAQFDVPEGTLVYSYRDCDGYREGLRLPDGTLAPRNRAYRGVGAEFFLDPRGDWVGIRRARQNAGAYDIYIAVDDDHDDAPGVRAPGRFAEEWHDVVMWGTPTSPPPGGWWCHAGGDNYADQNTLPGAEAGPAGYRVPVWSGAPVQGTGPNLTGQPGGIRTGMSIRRERPSPYIAGLGGSGAVGGGVFEEYEDGNPVPVRYNLDSGTSADWVERVPVIGNESTLQGGEWIKVDLGEFPAPTVVEDDGDSILVNDAQYLPVASESNWVIMTSDQYATVNGVTAPIRFAYRQKTGNRLVVATRWVDRTPVDGTGATQLQAGAQLRLRVPLRLGVGQHHSAAQQFGYANYYQIKGVGWRRRWRGDGPPPVPSRYDIRLSAQASPNDPLTYLGENPDWLTVARVVDNSAPAQYHSVAGPFGPIHARWVIFHIYAMSDGGRARLNELTVYVAGGDGTAEAINPVNGIPSAAHTVSDVIDALLADAGVPRWARICYPSMAVRALTVSEGSVWRTVTALAERAALIVHERRDGRIVVKPDPRSVSAIGGVTPALTITLAVVRGQIRAGERPRHQAGQIEFLARNDVGQEEWHIVYPAVPLGIGGKLRLGTRFAMSKADALALADVELRRSNGGWTIEVPIGAYDDLELLDVVRVERIMLDESGQEIQGRDFFIVGAEYEATSRGMRGTLRLEERRT